MTDYVPELGQACFGNPTGRYDMPEFAHALFFYIKEEFERVHWNVSQTEFDVAEYDFWEKQPFDNIQWRRYWWGDEDAPEASMPNFAFENVEIRWYKHPGRGMSCNVEMPLDQWNEWFERCLKHLRDIDKKHDPVEALHISFGGDE